MAAKRKIRWSANAKEVLKNIFKFYNDRNGSNSYSTKLLVEFENAIALLPDNPELGIKTFNSDKIRYLIKGDYRIIYELNRHTIDILMVWDTRRNPDDLKIN